MEEYQKWLNETGQTELLGDQRAKEGDNMAAVTLYLRARVPGKAAALALSDASLSEDRDVLEQIAEVHSLFRAKIEHFNNNLSGFPRAIFNRRD